MLRFIVIAIGIFIVYKLLTGDKKRKEEKGQKQQEKMAASGELVRDPACGTYVSKDSDIRVRQGDKVHCFCSYDCRDKYIQKLEAPKEEPQAEKVQSEASAKEGEGQEKS